MRLGSRRSHSHHLDFTQNPSMKAIAFHEKAGRGHRYPGCYDAGSGKTRTCVPESIASSPATRLHLPTK
jgi:hypothetical protein